MSRVQYDGKRLIPAPYVNITKNYSYDGNGVIIGKTYSISLRGTVSAFKGSPKSDGTFWTTSGYPDDESIPANSRLASILRKQEAIRKLFSVNNLALEIQSLDASQPLKCYPRVISIDFAEGIWYDKVEYTINLEANALYPEKDDSLDGTFNLEDVSESWSIETDEGRAENEYIPRTYSIKHSVSAKAKPVYDENGVRLADGWERSKSYVLTKLGFDSTIALSSGINNLPSYYGAYNAVKSENIDKRNGSYSVDEAWVLSSGTATESFNISSESSNDSPFTTVTIDGDIAGFEERDSQMRLTTSKYSNALTKFSYSSGVALSRAQSFSGLTLNPQPLIFSCGRNPVGGTVQYSLKYDNRPTNLIPGTKSEVISVNDNHRGDVFAAIFCIGRSAGPVLQYVGAHTEATRSLSIELVMNTPAYSGNSVGDIKNMMLSPKMNPTYSGYIQNVIDAANPINNGYTQSYKSPAQETWDFKNGRYSYNITWTYE